MLILLDKVERPWCNCMGLTCTRLDSREDLRHFRLAQHMWYNFFCPPCRVQSLCHKNYNFLSNRRRLSSLSHNYCMYLYCRHTNRLDKFIMSHTLSQHRFGRLDSHKCRRVKVRMWQCTPNKQDQIRYKHCSVESESCITYKSCWEQSINRHRTGYRHQPTQVLGIRTYLLNLQKSYWHMLCKQKHLYSYCTLLHNIQYHYHSVCPFHRHNHRS